MGIVCIFAVIFPSSPHFSTLSVQSASSASHHSSMNQSAPVASRLGESPASLKTCVALSALRQTKSSSVFPFVKCFVRSCGRKKRSRKKTRLVGIELLGEAYWPGAISAC